MIVLKIIGVCILIAGVMTLFTWRLATDAQNLHAELDVLLNEAKQAKTKAELTDVWEKLKITNKKCWHHTFASRVVEIRTIIETKYPLVD